VVSEPKDEAAFGLAAQQNSISQHNLDSQGTPDSLTSQPKAFLLGNGWFVIQL
jgi:hypothetical protein